MPYTLVPESERQNIGLRYFTNSKVFLHFERTLFRLAKEEIIGYRGGYWEFYENGLTFFMAPGHDGDIEKWKLESQPTRSAKLDRIEVGIILSLYASGPVSFYGYQNNVRVSVFSNIYQNLYELINECPNRKIMYRLVD